ncbi:MAG: zur [Firmicutes bacterium]|nr:zur [Bacillota bacterium]
MTEKLIALLRSNGHKITPQRRAVIGALLACGHFVTAQQILDQVKKTHPDISLDTIYRNLGLLIGLGAVAEIRTPNRGGNLFEVLTADHHSHLVCLTCGRAKCLPFCPVQSSDLAQAGVDGFTITSHSLEFYGYCQECQASAEGENRPCCPK